MATSAGEASLPTVDAASETTTSFSAKPADYSLQKRIGRGGFAVVWLGVYLPAQQEVAIKIMEIDKLSVDFDSVMREITDMRLCRHPHILSTHTSFLDSKGKSLWVVTPLMRKGSCLRILELKAKRTGTVGGFEEDVVKVILHGAIKGLAYFHSQLKVHRDVKAGNLLMDADGTVKIADLGVAGWLHGDEAGDRTAGRKTFVGTPSWMAPEVLKADDPDFTGYNEKADVWSLGITALELAAGRSPYASFKSPMKILMSIMEDPAPSLDSYDDSMLSKNFSSDFKKFVSKCLNKDPKQRPTSKELLKEKFFKNVKSKSHLLEALLDKYEIPDVSSEEFDDFLDSSGGQEKTLGRGPSPAVLEIQKGTSSNFQEGTTWAFDDDTNEAPGEKDDILSEFEAGMAGLPGDES